MKNKTLIIALTLICLLGGTKTFAQISFGLKHGAAYTTLSELGNLYDNNHETYSYVAGIFSDFGIAKNLYIQPELNYISKGRGDEKSEINLLQPADFRLHYLQVPVLLQYHCVDFPNKSGASLYVNAGPYAGFVMHTQIRQAKDNEIITQNTSKFDSKTDWGAIMGIGCQVPIRKKDFRFEVRYDMGLSKIENQPDTYRTKAITVSAGMAL